MTADTGLAGPADTRVTRIVHSALLRDLEQAGATLTDWRTSEFTSLKTTPGGKQEITTAAAVLQRECRGRPRRTAGSIAPSGAFMTSTTRPLRGGDPRPIRAPI
ncbi:hypothetical protein ACQP1O_25015 [Nocardia sp. CA-151230]|uniref:hypothetical protein n=1 Tax=Nocardia sp. CA-151230 TaxID=3239982 RepID=UPI003D926E77